MPAAEARAVSTATSVVVATPQGTIITTTVYTSATPTDEPAAAPVPSSGPVDTVPVGAIAGGAVAGVFLAVAAVIAWHLWGRNIKRKEAEKRKQAFAFFQVRENTRRNASTLSRPQGSYRPSSTASSTSERKVKFVSLDPRVTFTDPNAAPASGSENEKTDANTPPSITPPIRAYTHAPARPSPLAKSVTPPDDSSSSSTEASVPPLPERPSPTRSNTDASKATTTTAPSSWRGPAMLEPPHLHHKSSNASSVSMYSTQSGEERQIRAPPSLIMAALSQPDPSQPLIPEYTPAQRLSATEGDDTNRLSHVSATSTSSREVGIAR